MGHTYLNYTRVLYEYNLKTIKERVSLTHNVSEFSNAH